MSKWMKNFLKQNLCSMLIVPLASYLAVSHGADGEWTECILWGVSALLHLAAICGRGAVR